VQGVVHREDGPASEYADGSVDWFLIGQQVTKEIVMDEEQRQALYKKLGRAE